MAGDQGTPLVRKLGIKAGHRVAVVGAPADFEGALGAVPEGVEVIDAASGEALSGSAYDVVVWFLTSRAELVSAVGRARNGGLLTAAGGSWVGWPKRASGIASSVDADVVREVALPTGLVDNKICAIDAAWSGIRLVLRRPLRSE